jgi:hypothetical protein
MKSRSRLLCISTQLRQLRGTTQTSSVRLDKRPKDLRHVILTTIASFPFTIDLAVDHHFVVGMYVQTTTTSKCFCFEEKVHVSLGSQQSFRSSQTVTPIVNSHSDTYSEWSTVIMMQTRSGQQSRLVRQGRQQNVSLIFWSRH